MLETLQNLINIFLLFLLDSSCIADDGLVPRASQTLFALLKNKKRTKKKKSINNNKEKKSYWSVKSSTGNYLDELVLPPFVKKLTSYPKVVKENHFLSKMVPTLCFNKSDFGQHWPVCTNEDVGEKIISI